MANLWRVLAIAWLGGIASPALMDDPATIGDALTVPVVAESTVEASPSSTEAVQLDADTAEDTTASHQDDSG